MAEKHVSEILSEYSDLQNNSGILFVNLVDNKKEQVTFREREGV
jgi:hypothetical protein